MAAILGDPRPARSAPSPDSRLCCGVKTIKGDIIRETGVGFFGEGMRLVLETEVGVLLGGCDNCCFSDPGWAVACGGVEICVGVDGFWTDLGNILTGLTGWSRNGDDCMGLDDAGAARLCRRALFVQPDEDLALGVEFSPSLTSSSSICFA